MNDETAGNTPPAWTPPAGGVPEDDKPTAPPFNANLFRERLVRPRDGKYVAGVCAALARATDTDPILWRVVFAVLGVMSGVGVLLYLIAWLITPAEGDTAAPAEALIGRGRSSLSPTSIVLLGLGALISFGFIVQDGMRATLLAAAVIVGAFLLIKRQMPATPAAPATMAPPAAPTAAKPEEKPAYTPPFAPHGPFTQKQFPFGDQGAPAFPFQAPLPPRAPKPPKPPRERSKLGRLTFFAVVVVLGLLAVINASGAAIPVSAFFAAGLAVIGAGLLVGTWFGRARGLIALALISTLGLFISTGVERWGGDIGHSVYQPATLAELPDRYDFTAGDATIDLTKLDLKGQQENVTVTMKLGQIKVLLPQNIDTNTTVSMHNGHAKVFGQDYAGNDLGNRTFNDNPAAASGGTLNLTVQLDTGNLEVSR